MWFGSSVDEKERQNRATEATVQGFRRKPGEYLEGKWGKPGRVLGNAFGYSFGIAAGFMYKLPTRIKGAVKIAASPVAGLTFGSAMGVIDIAYGGLSVAAGIVTGVVAGPFSQRARKKAYNLVTGGIKKVGLGLTAPFTVAGALLSSGAYNLVLGKESPWSVMDKYNKANENAHEKIWENTAPPKAKKESFQGVDGKLIESSSLLRGTDEQFVYLDDDELAPIGGKSKLEVPRAALDTNQGSKYNAAGGHGIASSKGGGRGVG